MLYFLKGAVLGFFIAVPVGPTGVLCIQHTLARGMMAGLGFGVGTALADTLYCAMAVFGVTFVADFLKENRLYLNLASGLALVYLGCHICRCQQAQSTPVAIVDSKFGAFTSAFLLTLTNPLMIVFFVTIFAGLGLSTGADYQESLLLVGGVFTGSAAAWLVLTRVVDRLRIKLCPERLRLVNRFSGMIITGLGVLWLIKAIIE